MIWIVEKKRVVHLAESGRRLAEVPLRVSFEFAVESGAVVEGSLSISVLYNEQVVRKHFPELGKSELDSDVRRTAYDAVHEHLVRSGLTAARCALRLLGRGRAHAAAAA